MEYNAILTREGDAVLVSFPDCPGCQTFGKDEAEALEMAADALDGWLWASLEVGSVPPRPAATGGVPVTVENSLAGALLREWDA